MKKIKLAATIISLDFSSREPVFNPKKNSPKYTIESHKIPILIVTSLKELINFLDNYTDFDKYHYGDYLSKKEILKTCSSFKMEITNWEVFKKDVLSESRFTPSWDWFKQHYQDTCIHVSRLPVGVQKRHIDEDLFHN